jgi:hypothetical protein
VALMPVRLLDVLGPDASDVRRVYDLSAGANLPVRIRLPDDVPIHAGLPEGGLEAGDLALVLVEADAVEAGGSILPAAAVGARALVVVVGPAESFPAPVFCSIAEAAGWQALAAAPVAVPGPAVAVLLARTDVLLPVRAYLDGGPAATLDARGLATDHVLSVVPVRALQCRTDALAIEVARLRERLVETEQARASSGKESDALRSALQESEGKLGELTRERDRLARRVSSIEGSRSWALLQRGRALTRALRRPDRS